MSTSSTTSSSPPPPSSGYRLKFRKEEFIELLQIAKPIRVYKVRKFYYFSFDGFIMYCEECSNDDLMAYKVVNAIEFSNASWTKR